MSPAAALRGLSIHDLVGEPVRLNRSIPLFASASVACRHAGHFSHYSAAVVFAPPQAADDSHDLTNRFLKKNRALPISFSWVNTRPPRQRRTNSSFDIDFTQRRRLVDVHIPKRGERTQPAIPARSRYGTE